MPEKWMSDAAQDIYYIVIVFVTKLWDFITSPKINWLGYNPHFVPFINLFV